MGLRVRLRLLHRDDVRQAARPAGAPLMNWKLSGIVAIALIGLPFVYHEPYPLHILVIVLIWSSMYTSWSVMGRFGLVSLGHGGFMGIGAYVTALLWNNFGLTPWLGIPAAIVAVAAIALLIA